MDNERKAGPPEETGAPSRVEPREAHPVPMSFGRRGGIFCGLPKNTIEVRRESIWQLQAWMR